MSIAKDANKYHDLKEEFQYHSEEASYYLEQYLRALEEVEGSYSKFKEHAEYRDQFSKELKEMSDVLS